jgi:exosome complex component RRP42
MAPVSTSTSAPTALSPAELSYLHTSLSLNPPIRPDTRSRTDFRNLVGELDILPSVHGSARLVQSSDGGECIVGIKAEVEKNPPDSTGDARREWVEIAVEVAGQRDDDPLTVFLSSVTSEAISSRVAGKLSIGKLWHWKLYIDVGSLCSM